MNAHLSEKPPKLQLRLLLIAALLCVLVIDLPITNITHNIIVKDAEARVGRPASPNSVAGVSRRTTRRTVRRPHRHRVAVGTRVVVVPAGYTTVVVSGATYYYYDDVYYRRYYEGTEIVYVVVEVP